MVPFQNAPSFLKDGYKWSGHRVCPIGDETLHCFRYSSRVELYLKEILFNMLDIVLEPDKIHYIWFFFQKSIQTTEFVW